jgi:hypothetical protein
MVRITQELFLKAVTEAIQKNGLSMDDDVCRISVPQFIFDTAFIDRYYDHWTERVDAIGGKFVRSLYLKEAPALDDFLRNILGYCVLNLNKNTRKYFPALK